MALQPGSGPGERPAPAGAWDRPDPGGPPEVPDTAAAPDTGGVEEDELPPPVDPAPLGWFLLGVVYALTAVYSAVPAQHSTLFGAGPAGAGRMAVALAVVPYALAGLYTGLTAAGRGWLYPVTFAAWPLLLERLALYLFGMAGRWMLAGFPAGWREAVPLAAALSFTRETLAPYATPAYMAWGLGSLALTASVHAGVRLAAGRWGRWRTGRARHGAPGAAGA